MDAGRADQDFSAVFEAQKHADATCDGKPPRSIEIPWTGNVDLIIFDLMYLVISPHGVWEVDVHSFSPRT